MEGETIVGVGSIGRGCTEDKPISPLLNPGEAVSTGLDLIVSEGVAEKVVSAQKGSFC